MSSSRRGAAERVGGQEKTSIVSVRLTSIERESLSAKAYQAQLALSSFIRACALSSFGQTSRSNRNDGYSDPAIKPPRAKKISATERTQLALVLACMGRLIDTINAFEDAPVNEQDQPLMLACLRREIRQTRDQCFVALGRKL